MNRLTKLVVLTLGPLYLAATPFVYAQATPDTVAPQPWVCTEWASQDALFNALPNIEQLSGRNPVTNCFIDPFPVACATGICIKLECRPNGSRYTDANNGNCPSNISN